MRLTLIQLDAVRYRMLWTWNHILFDGWSLAILMEEFLKPLALSQTALANAIAVLAASDEGGISRYWRANAAISAKAGAESEQNASSVSAAAEPSRSPRQTNLHLACGPFATRIGHPRQSRDPPHERDSCSRPTIRSPRPPRCG